MEEREEFFNGFCRTANQSRMISCIYVRGENGEWKLDEADCLMEKCRNRAACEIARQAMEGPLN